MSVSPVEYLKEKYFEPLNVRQEDLAQYLNLGYKTVNELLKNKRKLNLETAVRFAKLVGEDPKKLLQMQVEYDLENSNYQANEIKPLKMNSSLEKLLTELNKYTEYKKYSFNDLHQVFKKDNYKEEYFSLLKLLFTEVPLIYVVHYMFKNKIGLNHLKNMYEFYLNKLGGNKNSKVENMFLDTEKDVVEKLCNNGKYFDNSRDFEKYLYNRLIFFKHKQYFLQMAKDTLELDVKQRALYLYDFLSNKKQDEFKYNLNKNNLFSFYAKGKVRRSSKSNSFGLVNTINEDRFNQFKETGTF